MLPDKLEDLGISRRCLEFLKAQSISDVAGLLRSSPELLSRRPTYAAEIVTALERYAPAQDFARSLTVIPVAPAAGPNPTTPLEFALVILRRRQEPITLKLLKDEVQRESGARNLVSLRAQLEAEKAVIFYPFGLHQWVGLAEWGEKGVVAAARGAWTVLPVHLDVLKREQRTAEVSTEIHAVLVMLAQSGGHRDLLRLLEDWPHNVPQQPQVVREIAPPYKAPSGQIFADSQPGDAFHKLADLLFRQARNLGRPYSLCEMKVEPGDLEWLRSWAWQLKAGRVQEVLESNAPCFHVDGRLCSLRDCFGLLVMLLASEVARREAREGQVWNIVHPCFSVAARSVLFVQGQPRAPLREALESACRRFQLHHAFSLDGAQAWYQSIFLQFGFTYSGIKKLSTWLSVEESQPVAVTCLRRDSPVFGELWQALLSYRRHRSPDARTRLVDHLRNNPYLLPGWADDILRAATLSAAESGAVASTGEDVAYPHLVWPDGSSPKFCIQPATAFSDLNEPAYVVLHEDEQLARLYKELEGYVSDPGELVFRPTQERLQLTLIGDSSEDVRDLELQLWDPDALFSLYRLDNGERLDTLKPGIPCALLLADGVEVEPAADRTSPCGKTGFSLHRFAAGLTTAHQLRGGGQELSLLLEEAEPAWAKEVKLLCTQSAPATLPSRVQVDLVVPKGVRLRWARCGRQTVSMGEALGGYRGQVLLEPDLATTNLRLHVGLEKAGRKARVGCSCQVKVFSVTSWLDERWQVVQQRPQLSVRQAREGSFRCFTGDSPHRDFALIEGDVFSARPRPGTRSFGRLAGYGGDLRLRWGPFNADEEGLLLAREVTDPGLLRARSGGTLELSRPLDADELHCLVWWDGDNPPHLQPAERLEVATGSRWEGSPPPNSDACAVGLSYDGVRLGSNWDKVALSAHPISPECCAGMLRWLHLPILSPNWLTKVRPLAQSHALPFLESWLISATVSGCEALRHSAEMAEWNTVVREVFRGWKPADSRESQAILDKVSPENILRVSPYLLVRLVEALPKPTAVRDRQQIVEELLLQAPLGQHVKVLAELEDETGRAMGVDVKFVQSLVQRVRQVWTEGPTLNDRERLNLGLASNVAPFRRLVAARLLM